MPVRRSSAQIPPSNQVGTHCKAQYSRTTLLYLTLVRDGALPSGFQQEFESLVLRPSKPVQNGRYARRQSARTQTQSCNLHSLEQKRKDTEQADKTAADQFIQATSLKPRRVPGTVHEHVSSMDPQQGEIQKRQNETDGFFTLSELIKGTVTPMGKMLTHIPGQQLVGGGRRASTLRSRVRGVRKFLSWLALNRELSYPTSFDQLSEFLQVRLSEPCNRGALKGTHQSFVFLEEMVGTLAQSD